MRWDGLTNTGGVAGCDSGWCPEASGSIQAQHVRWRTPEIPCCGLACSIDTPVASYTTTYFGPCILCIQTLFGVPVGASGSVTHRQSVNSDLTRFDHWGGARLDRFYIDAHHKQYVVRATAIPVSGDFSDHLLVCLAFTGGHVAPASRRHLRRTKLWFKDAPQLAQEFVAFVDAAAAAAPTDPEDLIRWWAGFKGRMFDKAQQLNCRQRQLQALHPASDADTLQQLHAAICSATLDTPESAAQAEQTLQQYMAAHGVRAARRLAAGAATSAACRRTHVHEGERPNPKLTAWVKPPSKASITALKTPAGTLADTPGGCARVLTQQYARVSTLPPTTDAARQQVLAALRPPGSPGLEAAADRLGCGTVSESEVKRAIKLAKPGTAPGLDGLPVEVYQLCRRQLTGIMARLFSAISQLQRLPRAFLRRPHCSHL